MSFCLSNFHHVLNFQPPIFSPLSTDSKSSSILTSDFFQVLNKTKCFLNEILHQNMSAFMLTPSPNILHFLHISYTWFGSSLFRNKPSFCLFTIHLVFTSEMNDKKNCSHKISGSFQWSLSTGLSDEQCFCFGNVGRFNY